jgi:hypothetical protein
MNAATAAAFTVDDSKMENAVTVTEFNDGKRVSPQAIAPISLLFSVVITRFMRATQFLSKQNGLPGRAGQ